VEGLTEVVVSEAEAFNKWVALAMKRRVVGSHNMNAVSSRSHLCCLVCLSVVQGEQRLSSKLHLVDLAGSEAVRKTAASGVRFSEARHINKSLSALGHVIASLGPQDPSARTGHVPYRDSKLTRLLQNSLGGNAKTLVVLAVSAAQEHVAETVSTLKFGERARQIRSHATANIHRPADHQELMKALAMARKEISELKQTLLELQAVPPSRPAVCDICRHLLHQLLGPKTPPDPHPLGHEGPGEGDADREEAFLDPELPPDEEEEEEEESLLAKEEEEDMEGGKEGDREDQGEREGLEEDQEGLGLGEEVLQGDRCAVCLLNAEEADLLQRDTGQHLGQLFSCDGNCGGRFHVRCAGLVGDAGQFVLPDGDWCCLTCSLHMPTTCQLEREGEGGPGEEEGEGEAEEVDRNGQQVVERVTDGPPPVHAPPRPLVSIVADYHRMRRERNRVLAMWQQETRMQRVLEVGRQRRQRQADFEAIALRRDLETARDMQRKALEECERLRALLDDSMKQFQQQLQQQRQVFAESASVGGGSGAGWRTLIAASIANEQVSAPVSLRTVHSPRTVSHISPRPQEPSLHEISKSVEDLPFPEPLDQEEEGEGLGEDPRAASSSKFINPLRNRLQDLLKSVEAETGSFAEIRQKYHDKPGTRQRKRVSKLPTGT